MKLGPAIRRLMSPAMERRTAGIYRAIFVDLNLVAASLAEHLPVDAKLLDIGGGDGELLNSLLDLRPDVTVTMVDIAQTVGKFVQSRHRERVVLRPLTPLEKYLESSTHQYDVALASDVIHHLPASYRPAFFHALRQALVPNGSIFVKDIEPGFFVSKLSLFCDMYISGDRGVTLLSSEALRTLARDELPPHSASEIGLFEKDPPNYIVRLDFSDQNTCDAKQPESNAAH